MKNCEELFRPLGLAESKCLKKLESLYETQILEKGMFHNDENFCIIMEDSDTLKMAEIVKLNGKTH